MALKQILITLSKAIPPLICIGYIFWTGWHGILGIMIGSSLLMYLIATDNPTIGVIIASLQVKDETKKLKEYIDAEIIEKEKK